MELSQRLQGGLEVVLASPASLEILRLAGHEPCTMCPTFFCDGSLIGSLPPQFKCKRKLNIHNADKKILLSAILDEGNK